LPFASVCARTSACRAATSSADQSARVYVSVGVGQRGLVKSRGERPPERIAVAFVFEASGVGNNPDPIATVMGANG
jgi:hypothetical protein